MIFTAVAEGRLHLTGVPENGDELIAAATHKSKDEIRQLLGERFPRSEMLALVETLPGAPFLRNEQLVPEPVGVGAFLDTPAPAQALAPVPRTEVRPHAPQRFALHLTIDQDTHDLLRHAQNLLGHQIPSGDVALVIQRALKVLVLRLEQRKFAATTKPRGRRRASANPRYIPAHVKRAVWKRDQGQCTFVGHTGQRCAARRCLEFDHVHPVARGGQATVENVRLACARHNQYVAERTFGAGFMEERRQKSLRVAEAQAKAAAEPSAAEARARAIAKEHAQDVLKGLRNLGCSAAEARRAAEFSETLAGTGLEERMRAALRFLCPKPRFHGQLGPGPGAPS